MATWIHSRSFFKIPFASQHVNRSQTLKKSAGEHFYSTLYSLETWPLVRLEIPGLLINPMTAVAKYFRYNTGNLSQPVKMGLSSEPKNFYVYFIAFLESI